jgi:dienelactone hydrolase
MASKSLHTHRSLPSQLTQPCQCSTKLHQLRRNIRKVVEKAWMQKNLKEAGNPSETVVYPNTLHGLHADYRPTYRKEQAEDGDKRLQAWFKQYGVS